MSHVARVIIPSADQLLCERCGYVLSGLPAGGNCPECGTPIGESSPDLRHAPAWEDGADPRPKILRFFLTTAAVTFRPRAFYRSLATRLPGNGARAFALVHWAVTSLLLGVAVYLHARWYSDFADVINRFAIVSGVVIVVTIFLALAVTTYVAARLTRWEAAYRGLRLPMPVVLRAMEYHAAHYVPVALFVLATVLVNREVFPDVGVVPKYLYVLCGEVVLAAGYLFKTYWTGMRNVMYANR